MSVELVASRSVKVNVGDYQSTDIFESQKVTWDELSTDTLEEARRKLHLAVEVSMHQQLRRFYQSRGQKPSDAEIAKRHGISVG